MRSSLASSFTLNTNTDQVFYHFLQTLIEELKRLFDKYVLKIQDFKRMAQCRELVPIPELNGIISLCKLFDVLATPENGVSMDYLLYLSCSKICIVI